MRAARRRSSQVCALVLVAVLAVTAAVGDAALGLRPAFAAPAARPPGAHAVPLPRSAPPPAKPVAPARPAGDFTPLTTAAGTAGSHFDPRRSTPVARSMFAEEYVNPDGTHSFRQSTAPLNVQDAAGRWQPVDTVLQVDAASRRAAPRRQPMSPSLAGRADDPALLSLEVASHRVSLGLENAAPRSASVRGAAVSYASVRPDTDLQYEVTAGSVKETILLRKAPPTGQASWRFRLDTDGLTPALDGEGAVRLADAAGVVRMVVPPVEVWDSAGGGARAPATTGGRYQLDREGTGWALTVSVDEGWLRGNGRVYPVHVDPTVTLGVVESHDYRSDGFACDACGLRIGNSQHLGDSYNRAVFNFNWSPIVGRTVVGARMDVTRNTSVVGSVKTWNADLYHATAFDYDGVGEYLASGLVGDVGSFTGAGLTSQVAAIASTGNTTPFLMLVGSEVPGTWTYKVLDATLTVDTGTAPPATSIVAPADGSVMTSLTPTLSVAPVSDPDGDRVAYCFRVATGPDARSGVVVDSGCLPSPQWTIPAGVLQDGTAYTWQASTYSGISTTTPQWIGHLKVDQRIGERGPSPTDTAGTVTTNLANGNVTVTDGGPSFTTVGGSAGLTFTYNSLQSSPTGLRASYYNDLSHNGIINPAQQPVLVRTEPQVDVNWDAASPFPPALGQDYYAVVWEGWFQAPATGTYLFAGVHAAGATITVNGGQVYSVSGPSDLNWTQATGVQLAAGQAVPVKVQLAKGLGGAGRMRLFTETTDGTTVPPQLVPSSWLTPSDPPALPAGWTLSADLDGSGVVYTRAQVADATIVLTDGSGAKHTWTRLSAGGYAPPAGEDGVLALDAGGQITLTEDGDVYVFNADGTLATEAATADSRHPAALQNVHSGAPLRLTQIKDPVSQRAHVLHYNRSGDDCYGGATPPAGADALPPAQMLCRVSYWDGTETRLWYSGGQLARVEDPGAEAADYAYSPSTGLLTMVREPLAVDWVAVDPANRDRIDTYTEIDYAATGGVMRPARVIEPTPLPARPEHDYRYDPANRRTFVDVAGLQPGAGFWSRVTYDDADRLLTETDATGRTTSHTWSAKDQLLTTTDPEGRVATTVYDDRDRPIDAYGPAPASCFAGQQPTAACAGTVAHTHVGYDEGLAGLSAAYYDNASLTGAPKSYITGVGTDDGRLTVKLGGPLVGLAGKCLDLSNSGTADGTRVQLWTCNGTDAQRWTRAGNTFRALGKCLDVSNSGTADGTPVQLWTCNGSGAQDWAVQADGSLTNPQSGKCLDVTSGNPADGTQIQILTCSGGGGQRWALPPNTGSPTAGIPSTTWSARFTGEVQLPAAGTYALGFDVVGSARLWIDDTLVADGWPDHPTLGAASGGFTNAAAGSWHRVRIDYANSGGNGLLNLTWQPPGQAWQVVPGPALGPRYGLETSSVESESAGLPDRTTTTTYGGAGLDPVFGLPAATTVDPAGLRLSGTSTYETPGAGYLRQTSRTRPSGAATTTAYYGDTEARANPCVSGSAAVNQGGLPRLLTSAMPAAGSARTDERVYDASGRVVASAVSGGWTCATYDVRDRVVQQTYPALGGAPARTVTFNYAVGGDPLTASTTDPAGTITTVSDLLGRVVSYTDVNGTRTDTTYDLPGRVASERIAYAGTGNPPDTIGYTYDDAGRTLTETWDGAALATTAYDAGGELASVGYGNGASLAAIGRDQAGSPASLRWTASGGAGFTSAVTRTRAGTIVNESINGADPNPGGLDYVYDAAGRLVQAYAAGHHFTYDYTSAAAASCPAGTRANAGANTNRMRLLDQTGAGTAETDYCYDAADRLLATSGAVAMSGVTYDSHGNTTSFASAGQTTALRWDGADRNVGLSATGGGAPRNATVTYTRDAANRIVRRDATSLIDPTGTILYSYLGGDDSAAVTYDGSHTLLSITLDLPGGMLVAASKDAQGSVVQAWNASTVRGDLFFVTDIHGVQVGGIYRYDPFGNPLDASGVENDQAVPDNQPGALDYGWLGQHQRPYEHAGGLAIVEMGARPYIPLLGRFLSVDPIPGGSANDYEYASGDPVNNTDLDGLNRKKRKKDPLNQKNRKPHPPKGKGKSKRDRHQKAGRQGGRRRIPPNPNKRRRGGQGKKDGGNTGGQSNLINLEPLWELLEELGAEIRGWFHFGRGPAPAPAPAPAAPSGGCGIFHLPVIFISIRLDPCVAAYWRGTGPPAPAVPAEPAQEPARPYV